MIVEVTGFILAVSLANERLIEVLKTIWPWLATQHSDTEENSENSVQEKTRRITFQFISIVTGWVSAGVLAAKDGAYIDLFGFMTFGTDTRLHVLVLGILSSAGSVFWSQLLGYSKALKDVKKQEANQEKIESNKLKENILRKGKYQSMQHALESQGPPPFEA